LFTNLQSDGIVGPFELNQDGLVDRLIRQLDVASGQFKNFHMNSETCRQLLSSTELKNQIEKGFGQELLLWRTNAFKKIDGSGEVDWHHDRHFEDGDSLINFSNLGNHFSILVALTDMDDASGVMEFILELIYLKKVMYKMNDHFIYEHLKSIFLIFQLTC